MRFFFVVPVAVDDQLEKMLGYVGIGPADLEDQNGGFLRLGYIQIIGIFFTNPHLNAGFLHRGALNGGAFQQFDLGAEIGFTFIGKKIGVVEANIVVKEYLSEGNILGSVDGFIGHCGTYQNGKADQHHPPTLAQIREVAALGHHHGQPIGRGRSGGHRLHRQIYRFFTHNIGVLRRSGLIPSERTFAPHRYMHLSARVNFIAI